MFKISIMQIDENENEEIIVRCHEINNDVLTVVERLKSGNNVLLGSKGSEVFRINPKDVFYIESVDNKSFICLKESVFETKLKLYEIEEQLQNTGFFRCSKSMILNISKIRSVSPTLNGRFEAKLFNGESVIISRQYVPLLKKKLGM